MHLLRSEPALEELTLTGLVPGHQYSCLEMGPSLHFYSLIHLVEGSWESIMWTVQGWHPELGRQIWVSGVYPWWSNERRRGLHSAGVRVEEVPS